LIRCKYCGQDVITVNHAGVGKREVLAHDSKIIHLCRSIVAHQKRRAAARRNSRETIHAHKKRRAAAHRNSRETIHTVGPERADHHATYQKTCQWCGEPVHLVWVDGRYRAQNVTGSHHYCSSRAFVPVRVDCPGCGVPILKCRQGRTGRVALTEVDGKTAHICSRHLPVRIVIRPADPEDTTLSSWLHAERPTLEPIPEAGENYCPSCGKLLAGSGDDRSCMHCSA